MALRDRKPFRACLDKIWLKSIRWIRRSKNGYPLASILVLSGVEVYLSSFSLGGINVLFTSVSTDSELSFETSPGFDSFKGQKISKSIYLKSLLS